MQFFISSLIFCTKASSVIEKIKSAISLYDSLIFEKVSIDFLLHKAELPFIIQKAGRWWDKDKEIDIVALGENEILFGECKYWDRPVGISVLNELIEKAKYVDLKDKNRKEYFAIFSKGGFKKELKDLSKKVDNIFLFSLKEY